MFKKHKTSDSISMLIKVIKKIILKKNDDFSLNVDLRVHGNFRMLWKLYFILER